MAATNPLAALLGMSVRASKQTISKTINAMPATRPTTAATQESSAPSNNRPMSDGTTISAAPVFLSNYSDACFVERICQSTQRSDDKALWKLAPEPKKA